MVNFVYKTDEEKELLEDILNLANKIVYNKELPDSVKDNCKFVNYFYYDKELQMKIDNPRNNQYDDSNIQYFRMYDIKPEEKKEVLKLMVNVVTFYNSGDDYSDSPNIFMTTLLRKVLRDKFQEDYPKNILDNISDLALIAFSNSSNIEDNNDLMNSFLYNRNELRNKYEDVLGKGTFNNFNEITYRLEYDYLLNNNNVSDNEFNYIINSLKDYLYKRVDKNNNISEDDKNNIINMFNEKYDDLVREQRIHQEHKKSSY